VKLSQQRKVEVAAKRYQSTRGGSDGGSGCGGNMAAQPCNIITAVQSESDCQKKKKVIINQRWQ